MVCSLMVSTSNFKTYIRTSGKNQEYAHKWLEDFQMHSKCTMRVERTYPHSGTKNIYKVRIELFLFIRKFLSVSYLGTSSLTNIYSHSFITFVHFLIFPHFSYFAFSSLFYSWTSDASTIHDLVLRKYVTS